MSEQRKHTEQAYIDAWILLIREGLDFRNSADALESLTEIENNGCPLDHQDSKGVCHYPSGDCPCFDVAERLGFSTSKRFVMPFTPDFGEEQWR